ncbi:MAG: heavy-metal-associated domain-containing protein [Acidimicrobiales bacterium]
MSTVVLRVPDVSCDHCKGSIESAMAETPGVGSAAVSVTEKQVNIDYDDQVTDIESIKTALDAIGFPVAD